MVITHSFSAHVQEPFFPYLVQDVGGGCVVTVTGVQTDWEPPSICEYHVEKGPASEILLFNLRTVWVVGTRSV